MKKESPARKVETAKVNVRNRVQAERANFIKYTENDH
jgi:hypothetical protein